MVKTKITLDDGRVRKIEDCELVVAIGLGSKKEEQQIQLAVMGGKGLRSSAMIQGLADATVDAINTLAEDDYHAIAMLTTFMEKVGESCKEKMLERLTNGN